MKKNKPLDKEDLDEAVALVLKYTKDLNELQLKALYFGIWVEYYERCEEWKETLK